MAATSNRSKKTRMDKPDFSKAVDETITGVSNNSNSGGNVKPPTNKKSGRPAGEPSKHISLSVPESLYDDINIAAALLCKGNRTAYINSLIKKDLKDNGAKYREFKRIMDKL